MHRPDARAAPARAPAAARHAGPPCSPPCPVPLPGAPGPDAKVAKEAEAGAGRPQVPCRSGSPRWRSPALTCALNWRRVAASAAPCLLALAPAAASNSLRTPRALLLPATLLHPPGRLLPHSTREASRMQACSSVASRGGVSLPRRAAGGRAAARGTRLVVQAKVDLQGAPRIIRGKCYVTKDVSDGAGCKAGLRAHTFRACWRTTLPGRLRSWLPCLVVFCARP